MAQAKILYFASGRARAEISIFLSDRAGSGTKFLSLLRARPSRAEIAIFAGRAGPDSGLKNPARADLYPGIKNLVNKALGVLF